MPEAECAALAKDGAVLSEASLAAPEELVKIGRR
jgi:hypothetical protein